MREATSTAAGDRRADARSTVALALTKFVLVGAAYYVSAVLGLRLSLVEVNVTPLWPPTGIAVAAFVLFGWRLWPGVAVAAFLVNLPITPTPAAAALTAVGNTLAPLAAVTLLTLVGFRREIDRFRDAFAIVVLGALVAMLISASVGAGTLVLFDAIPPSEFPGAWAVWWTGDAMGVLVVAPFLLTLRRPRWDHATPWARRIEAAILLFAVTAASFAVFATGSGFRFLLIPFLGWAAWRFGQPGATPVALIVIGMACWSAAQGYGSFGRGPLLNTMLTLQAFNATVAFTALFLSALVAERTRGREALERAAADLERRVEERTHELQQREHQLAEAQRVAKLGSWEWRIPQNEVWWSDEMFAIYGYPGRVGRMTFETSVERIVPEDLDRIRANLERGLTARRNHDLPEIEYRVAHHDGTERVLLGRARLEVSASGEPVRMIGTVQDVTETRRAEREHHIAVTLQRSLLPDRLPEITGVQMAARYVPATEESDVGGDWYDVVELPSARIGLVVGDIAGHGLRAASTMGQLRMAFRAYATEERSPADVVGRVHRLFQRLGVSEMATLIYLVFDPETDEIRFSNAGHPPPLLVDESGTARYVEGGLAPPLGAMPDGESYREARAELPVGSTLILFTDGLVEQRGVSLNEGLAHLKGAAVRAVGDLDELCDHLLTSLVGDDAEDDVAVLAVRPISLRDSPLRLEMPAEPYVLSRLRRAARRWLRAVDAPARDAYDVLVACGEACTNAIQHAYGAGEGAIEVRLERVNGAIDVTVRDFGSWRRVSDEDGGHGLNLMRGLMDSVEVDTTPEGTVVRMRREIHPS